ncbi:hypothetical protein A943_12475 [Bacillus sp. CPSM8]|nr:hypothetical protein A943_12475 [Bacillus sp. CPSM8]KUL09643.1 hypothetical protein LI17339_15145 [Bacillus licheniformis LMG 17339]KUL09754.1 hypothetical protein LI7559_12265 [Bacillus licheniformis LMG 7559]KUL17461.1 hypothetical protein LI6934_11095 [Bacillus licheniformis LMG 6934]
MKKALMNDLSVFFAAEMTAFTLFCLMDRFMIR